jgi:hypothetical protein
MSRFKFNIILFMLSTGLTPFAIGQYTGAVARIDSTSILIGDRVKLELTVTVPAGNFVHWPIFADTLARNLEILRKSPIDTVSSKKDLYTLKQELFITSFDSGSYVIPPIVFKYNRKGDTISYFTETNPIRFEVDAPETDPSQDIRPIKPPLRAPVTLSEILPWAGLLILLSLIAFLVYYFLIRKKAHAPIITTRLKPTIPPYEAAIEALENLRHKKLWQAGRIKEYYSELTDIIREYIELRFPVRAMEMTTTEIESALRQTEVNAQAREKLHQTLLLADLVKFAKEQPLPLENDLSLNNCVDFVRETRPRREEELIQPADKEGITRKPDA